MARRGGDKDGMEVDVAEVPLLRLQLFCDVVLGYEHCKYHHSSHSWNLQYRQLFQSLQQQGKHLEMWALRSECALLLSLNGCDEVPCT